jgi:hypothetical protein
MQTHVLIPESGVPSCEHDQGRNAQRARLRLFPRGPVVSGMWRVRNYARRAQLRLFFLETARHSLLPQPKALLALGSARNQNLYKTAKISKTQPDELLSSGHPLDADTVQRSFEGSNAISLSTAWCLPQRMNSMISGPEGSSPKVATSLTKHLMNLMASTGQPERTLLTQALWVV